MFMGLACCGRGCRISVPITIEVSAHGKRAVENFKFGAV
jgi:hypothetical protein